MKTAISVILLVLAARSSRYFKRWANFTSHRNLSRGWTPTVLIFG
jgi:hypothetical protein